MADGRIIIDTSIDNSGAISGLKNLSGKLSSVAGTGLKVFTGAVTAAGTAIGAIGAYALKVGSDFEAGMSKVEAISGATGSELESLTEKAKEMGAKTKFSATESASAFEYMAMAGWKTTDMLNGIEGVMYLAAASGEDLAMVSDIVTDSLTAFGLQASDSAHFADVLAKASASSNTNVGLMGNTFQYVAPVAGALKYSIEDTAVAIGLMANAGIKGEKSGTALRGLFTNLVKPTDTVAGAMTRLGIEVSNADGTMKPLNELIIDMRSSFANLTDEQKASEAAALAGKEGMSGLLAIVNASDEDFKNLTESINNSSGAAENMADIMNNNLQGQVTILKSAIEGLGIELYESIDNPMKDVIKTANGMVTELTSAFKEDGFEGLVLKLGDVFSQVITNIASQAPKFIDLAVKVIKSFVTGIKNNLPQITKGAIDVMMSLVNGIIDLLPMVLEVGLKAIIALRQGIAESLPTLIPAIFGLVDSMCDMLIENLPLLTKSGNEALLALGKGISENLPNLIPILVDLVISICDMIIENLPLILDVAIDIILALIQGLIEALPTLIEEVPRIINSFADGVYKALPKILEAGIDIILMLIKGLITSIPTLVYNIPQIIKAIVNVFTLMNWASIGKNLITNIGNGITSMVGNIGSIAKNLATNTLETIKAIFTGGNGVGSNFINLIKTGISSMIGGIKNIASNLAQGVVGSIKNIFSSGADIGSNLIKGIWNGISNMTGWIIDLIGGFAGSVVGSIKNFFKIKSPSRLMRDLIGVNLVKGIGVGVEVETPNLEKDINSNMSDLVSKMQSTVDYETAMTTARVSSNNNKNIPTTISNNEDVPNGSLFIIKNYMDSEEISEYTYEKSGNKFALAGKRVR